MIRKVSLEGVRKHQKWTCERERGHSIAIWWQQKELNYEPAVFTQVSDLIWFPMANKVAIFIGPTPLLTVCSHHDIQGVFTAYHHVPPLLLEHQIFLLKLFHKHGSKSLAQCEEPCSQI